MEQRVDKYHLMLLGAVLVFLAWSAIKPADWFTWMLEIMPVFIAMPVIMFTYNTFRMSTLIYSLICIHAIILIVGGHYTYAQMPVFNWIRDALGLARNHYDRQGHFAQGFVPAMIAREVLLCTTPLKTGKWLAFIVICICMAISASYELIEWAVAEMTGTAADAFLGSQGDVWDSQKDIAMALVGAIIAVVTLSGYHDRILEKTTLER
jgi:putative membrane protein